MITPIEINLTAVVLALREGEPVIYARNTPDIGLGLPSGPFDPRRHRTMARALHQFVAEQAGLTLGYVEQLYTFGDRGRHAGEIGADDAPHIVSIGYLALTRIEAEEAKPFLALYRAFPWEDWRCGPPEVIAREILPCLEAWAAEGGEASLREARYARIAMVFGVPEVPFDEEKVLERYEILYEAGLVFEARRDGREAAMRRPALPELGRPMAFDHRRILATALGRIRAKIKYRPVIFELMPPWFSLTELQRKVEAIAGHRLHKQNFRRLVESGALVEPTGAQSLTGGRPAALFRFRRAVLAERPAPGLRLGKSG